MDISSKPGSHLSPYLLIFSILILNTYPTFSLSPNFNSEITLIGDAKFNTTDSSVQLTNPTTPPSSGLVILNKPFKFLDPKTTSIHTHFTFSISPHHHNGDAIALLIGPSDFPTTFPGKRFSDLYGENQVLGIEFGTEFDGTMSVKVGNVSSLVELGLNSGLKLHSWVDYDAGLKRLEIRLTRFGYDRPDKPLLIYQIDLLEIWKDEEVLVGLSSSNRNSSVQMSTVYSWDFRVASFPKWLHSQPVDPRIYSNENGEVKMERKKRGCVFGFLSGFIFATGCGALVAFVVLILWVIFVGRHTVIPEEECSMLPMDFRYEKINVVVEDDGSQDLKK